MQVRPIRSPTLGPLLLTAALALAACARPGPEQRLRESLQALQAAVEERDADALEGALAEDFIGPGGLDRAGARRLAQASFLRYRHVGVSLGPADVRLRGDRAEVSFTAALTGGSGRWPDAARLYAVRTGWREVEGEWRLVSAEWTPRS